MKLLVNQFEFTRVYLVLNIKQSKSHTRNLLHITHVESACALVLCSHILFHNTIHWHVYVPVISNSGFKS